MLQKSVSLTLIEPHHCLSTVLQFGHFESVHCDIFLRKAHAREKIAACTGARVCPGTHAFNQN